MTGTPLPPLEQGGTWKNTKKMQKGGPGKFCFVKGEPEGFFSFLAGGWGAGAGGPWDHFCWGLYPLCLSCLVPLNSSTQATKPESTKIK